MATLVALALVTVTTAGLVGLLSANSAPSEQDQCALPLSQRVGGWFCTGEIPPP